MVITVTRIVPQGILTSCSVLRLDSVATFHVFKNRWTFSGRGWNHAAPEPQDCHLMMKMSCHHHQGTGVATMEE